MRKSIYNRELNKDFGNHKLVEITHEDLRPLTDAIVLRGAKATAVHVRKIVLNIYRWAIERGQNAEKTTEMILPNRSVCTA